jgi:HAD superfamily hydrolase (TIGR01549 family)
MPSHIETVIFDLDGTLRHNIPSADETVYNYAVELGAPSSLECRHAGARWAHYYWAQSQELAEDLDQYNDLNPDFWRNYSRRYLNSISLSDQQAIDLALELTQRMEEGYKPQSQVLPEAFATLSSLQEAGFTLGLVSNRSQPCHEECQELGLTPYFDFLYVAAEVGAWKPDPAIFERAFRESDSSPDQTVYIGDNYYADIIGAQRAGMLPILLDPEGVFPDAECTIIRSLEELLNLEIISANGSSAREERV